MKEPMPSAPTPDLATPDPQPLDAEGLADLLADAGYKARSYSGRGMYGARCVSVNLDGLSELLAIGGAIRAAAPDDVDRLARDARTDSMGMGTVVYWPSLEVGPDFDAGLGDEDDEGDES